MKHILLVLALLGSTAMADYRDAIDDVEWYTADEPGMTYVKVYYVDGGNSKLLMKESEVGTEAMYKAIEKMVVSRENSWHTKSK